MMRSIMRSINIFIVLFTAVMLVSCGGGGSGTPAGTGTLSLGLTDAAGDYLHVYVTIREIQVNRAAEEEDDESGWITVMEPHKTIDLKALENGEIFDLGLAELEAGHYNQLRLILGSEPDDSTEHNHPNYLVIEGDAAGEFLEEPLKVPSGFQTGIKIVRGFEIIAQGTTALILDFDADRSVVKAGNSGQWLLKPTIKVLETVENSVNGTVVEEGTGSPVPGAAVSAQIFDPAAELRNQVMVESATTTTAEGAYRLLLPPDIYNVVVTTENFQTACQEVEAFYYEEYVADFSLESRDTTTDITLTFNVSGLDPDETAFLSVRQPNVNCGGAENATIEIASDHVVEGSYDFTLPAGTYDLVAYTTDETVEATGINSTTGTDVTFTPTP